MIFGHDFRRDAPYTLTIKPALLLTQPMRKSTITLLLTLALAGAAQAQQSTVKGVIKDTSEQKELPNAVIAVLRQSDSVLQSFTRSQPNGVFILKNLPPGQYLLMVTYPKFADYV